MKLVVFVLVSLTIFTLSLSSKIENQMEGTDFHSTSTHTSARSIPQRPSKPNPALAALFLRRTCAKVNCPLGMHNPHKPRKVKSRGGPVRRVAVLAKNLVKRAVRGVKKAGRKAKHFFKNLLRKPKRARKPVTRRLNKVIRSPKGPVRRTRAGARRPKKASRKISKRVRKLIKKARRAARKSLRKSSARSGRRHATRHARRHARSHARKHRGHARKLRGHARKHRGHARKVAPRRKVTRRRVVVHRAPRGGRGFRAGKPAPRPARKPQQSAAAKKAALVRQCCVANRKVAARLVAPAGPRAPTFRGAGGPMPTTSNIH